MSKRPKDLLDILSLSAETIGEIFRRTADLKSGRRVRPLEGKTLGMIFQKPSTRTSVSFAVGMYQLGGQPLLLNYQDMQLRRGETLADTARTLSRYLDGIVIRTFDHQEAVELARHADIPVLNGLTDLHHPCQVLSDLVTVLEKKNLRLEKPDPDRFRKIRIAYVGDGNNVAHSWLHAAAVLGLDLAVACPKGYEPEGKVVEEALFAGRQTGANIRLTHDPAEAAEGADVLYTDVWASMGKEDEKEKRKAIFEPFQVNARLLARAKKDCVVMHCLPARRGEEITDDVLDGERSAVFDQAENRLHAQKAILWMWLADGR